ncbi:PUA-like domain-containing protein [Phakopsora pachyrhizi]|uniref:PUA-like domain-containing protein n=1 Tax=Phakopsora pachyrhizi TaxID=170000 RepID=A0AAV0B5X3_PHAPC|nr:PUA-like domain-containing protein [Phakopsora pachyrhizi]CAH7681068.1 PUA-like domain-containing protein [Phakopsora pachyrhizi]
MDGHRNAWLMKIDDLERAEVEHWDGVRNHEAKNLMKDQMKVGDPVLFYHSNCKVPGVSGIAKINKAGYPDFTAFDHRHPYYDPKSSEEKPTWYMVDVKFVSKFPNFVPLKILQNLANSSLEPPDYLVPEDVKSIKEMALINRGRLSVQPVSYRAFEAVKKLGESGFRNDIEDLKSPKLSSSNKKRQNCEAKGKSSPSIEKQETTKSKRVKKSKK